MKNIFKLIMGAGLLCVFAPLREMAHAAEPWSTYRGNLERTANADNLPGPATPKVLWVFKSQEHFIAAPVPHGEHLFISGLGAFNVSTFYCLAANPKAASRVA